MKKSFLILQDGTAFEGLSPDWQIDYSEGEVVFTTGMTGYYETLTDPSYASQIIVFTYPIMGNYGVAEKSFWESEKIHAKGVVINNLCEKWSHAKGIDSLLGFLKSQAVPVITGVDTRRLTKILRDSGVMLGAISFSQEILLSFEDPFKESILSRVSVSKKMQHGLGKKKVIVVDCGMKANILRCLENLPIEIERVPYNYDYSQDQYDGVFLSNGPGDPATCGETIAVLRRALEAKKPVFGICLGTQLLAHAVGAKTYKLTFGHRGHNQPCMDLQTRRCYITSQNHGYAIDEATLPVEWEVSFRNLNDGTVEGIRHKTYPFSAVQFHPEAAPGPVDTKWMFEAFYNQL